MIMQARLSRVGRRGPQDTLLLHYSRRLVVVVRNFPLLAGPGDIVRDDLLDRKLRRPAEPPQFEGIRDGVPRVPDTELAPERRGEVHAGRGRDNARELQHGYAAPPAHIEDFEVALRAFEYEQMRRSHIADMDVVAELFSVFVNDRRLVIQQALREGAADAGIGVVDRVPRTLHD